MKINSLSRILLFSSPTVLGAFLLNLLHSDSALAVDVKVEAPNNSLTSAEPDPASLPCDRTNCTGNRYLAAFPQVDTSDNTVEEFPNVEQNEAGHLLLEVTEEESDTAVSMFGCDCVKAINALRQLRGIPVGVEGDRILPGPLIRPCTQRLPS
jgi:hypothetical protein